MLGVSLPFSINHFSGHKASVNSELWLRKRQRIQRQLRQHRGAACGLLSKPRQPNMHGHERKPSTPL
jgi:hypothetical protein